MVIIFSREGQLANRLWNASHILANSLENDYRVVHLYFDDYYPFFSEQLDQIHKGFYIVGRHTKLIARSCQTFAGFLRKAMLKFGIRKLPFIELIHYEGYGPDDQAFDLSHPEFVVKAKQKIVLVSGWRFEDKKALERHKKEMPDLDAFPYLTVFIYNS